eukprot:gnl/Hemi2/10968_TR3759_c1_g1_i1.p1 gnl/Hemi2/10968_TR3759_c1_g1~~gnl/Hemi2/10968_TR3759_c1_g1_i1.p1  ORF type:complete len:419 (+),score=122.63 gnl/Hemi2/10968_TR3759_c1_g1_i1:36-1292(+)
MVQVQVKPVAGAAFGIELSDAETVESLKEKLHVATGTEVDKQRLLFSGKLLAAGPLSQFKIAAGQTIVLIPQFDKTTSTAVELDLVFCVDCTGSMGSYIAQCKQNIQNIVETVIASEGADVRFALVMYRDHPPQDSSYITQVCEFTGAIDEMKAYVNRMSASGGGDGPEAVAAGLYAALNLPYRDSATKVCVFIADAPPHGLEESGDGFPEGDPNTQDLLATCRGYPASRIRLYSVGCEPAISNYPRSCSFMDWAASLSGGKYISLLQAAVLSSVIIGGCREELNFDKLAKAVHAELRRMRTDQTLDQSIFRPEHRAALCERVALELNGKNMTTVNLEFQNASNPSLFVYKEVFHHAKDLRDAKKLIQNSTVDPVDKKAVGNSQPQAKCVVVPISPQHIARVFARDARELGLEAVNGT